MKAMLERTSPKQMYGFLYKRKINMASWINKNRSNSVCFKNKKADFCLKSEIEVFI